MTFVIVIVGAVIFFIAMAVFLDNDNSLEKSHQNKMQINKIRSTSEFIPTKSYFSKNNKSGIEISEENKLIRIFHLDHNNNIKTKIYPFSSLIESEVKIDNQSVFKTSRSSQLAGAAIGGVLAGGVGAIIGGLSGEKYKNEYVKNVDLIVKVDDYDTPLFRINFLSNVNELGIENKKGFKGSDTVVQDALRDVEYWQNILNLIIKNNS